MYKVLIVEDDPMVAMINQDYIEMIENFEVIGCVATKIDVFNSLKSNKIDLIILDVYLPNSDGLNILKKIREKQYLTDVIMVTAANGIEGIKKAMAYGVIDYLVKPFQRNRFNEAVDKFLTKNSFFETTNRSEKANLSQDKIDMFYTKPVMEKLDLPKGLHEKTLDRILSLLLKEKNKIWTIREISKELNISNVTIKKYMDYLESVRKISSTTTHGNIGRPEYNYRVIK
ncbi:response regulator [Psychrilyobacter atlanticus]|uniref:response regulator n=1 Tax=Psychrilyobacter atlanticus TaxID=271091 RepID=UPI00040C4D05|nr:response regulator [Psychrilyobacter atlanticus]